MPMGDLYFIRCLRVTTGHTLYIWDAWVGDRMVGSPQYTADTREELAAQMRIPVGSIPLQKAGYAEVIEV